MIVLGIPVVNQHQLTLDCVNALASSISGVTDEVRVVVIDNGSREPYDIKEFPQDTPFVLQLNRNDENLGFYYPLKQLQEEFPDAEYIGLMHNDVLMYEPGWDKRLVDEFEKDPNLSLIGLCGSNECDSNGGRGGGTMCNFNGTRGQSQAAGLKITDLQPSIVLDSLFMMFRASDIPVLKIREDIAPCHFYDKIWSMRMIEARKRVGTLGLEIDHMGGMTALADTQYWQEDAFTWCKKYNIPLEKNEAGDEDAGLTVYKEAERRFLGEYRDQKKLIPCKVSQDWVVTYG